MAHLLASWHRRQGFEDDLVNRVFCWEPSRHILPHAPAFRGDLCLLLCFNPTLLTPTKLPWVPLMLPRMFVSRRRFGGVIYRLRLTLVCSSSPSGSCREFLVSSVELALISLLVVLLLRSSGAVCLPFLSMPKGATFGWVFHWNFKQPVWALLLIY